jgi:tetratricopeptide (TPR) repeat protein
MRLELENIENILARKSMRIFFCDTTEKKLDIPSVLVFITGAKFCGPSKEIFWRNVTTGLIEESFFLRDYSQAEKYINKAGFLFKPDRTNYMYYRGRFLFLGKRYGEAAKFFRAVLNKTRLDALRESALIFLVYIYLKLKEKNKALKFYIKTLNLFPETYGFNDYEKFYLDTAYLKNSGNKTGLSGISFDNYLRKKSRYAKLFEKAQSYYYAEKYAEAIAAAKRAIKLMPMEVDAYLLLGSSYENTGCDKMALAIHEKAAAIVLKFSAIYLPLARLYLKLKKYKAAIAVANKIMTSGFKEERVHFLLGTCYGKTRQYLKAIGQLKKAEEINPFEPQINFSLFNCYRMTGRTGLARVELEKFIFKSKRKTIFNI